MKRLVKKGFTLIELVIVIVILGILAAALVPTYVDLSTSAKQAAIDASLASLQSAIAIKIGDTKTLPSTSDLTDVAGGTASGNTITTTIDGDTVTFTTYSDASCSTAASTGILCVAVTGS